MLSPSDRGPGLLIDESVQLPDDVILGANVVIYGGVTIAPGCVIQDHAVIGQVPLRPPGFILRESFATDTHIRPGAMLAVGAVVTAGATVEEGAMVGFHANLREGSVLGRDSVIGAKVGIGWGVQIGRGVRIRNNSLISPTCVIEDDVFIGAGVTATDSNALGDEVERRRPLEGVAFRRGCRVGSGVIFLPGVEVGEEATVAAGALVTRDVPAGVTVMGSPARVVRASSAEALR